MSLIPLPVDWQIPAVTLLLLFVIVAFFKEWGSPDLVALTATGIILATGLLPLDELLATFQNAAPITIACMFVLSAGLEASGCIDVMGNFFRRMAGEKELRVLLVLMVVGAVLSAFVNNTPVVVVFLPIVLSLAKSTNLKASRLLIPLSFASILGGTCTLTGTSTNLIIDGVAQVNGQPAFSMFELTKLGVIYAVIGFVYMATIGRRLLPERDTLDQEVESAEDRDFLTQVNVEEDSPLIGKTPAESLLKEFPSMQILEVRRRGVPLAQRLDELALQKNDRLLITIRADRFSEFKETEGIQFDAQRYRLKEMETRTLKLMEAIIGPQSKLIGKTLKELRFRQRFGVHILAVHRQGENLRDRMGTIKLHFGDTLLIEGSVDSINRVRRELDFISVTEPESRPIKKRRIVMGALITFGFVMGAATQVIPIVALAMLAAIAMMASRILKPTEAYAAIQWPIIFLIYGMLILGRAIEETGAAELAVNQITTLLGDTNPYLILAVIYLLSSTLTELISNNAVAALLTPIVIGIAGGEAFASYGPEGIDPRPFIVAVMFGCSASFATPIGYQTNTYVYGAGGYKFTDFVKVGLPLNILLWIVATFLIPWFWPFRAISKKP